MLYCLRDDGTCFFAPWEQVFWIGVRVERLPLVSGSHGSVLQHRGHSCNQCSKAQRRPGDKSAVNWQTFLQLFVAQPCFFFSLGLARNLSRSQDGISQLPVPTRAGFCLWMLCAWGVPIGSHFLAPSLGQGKEPQERQGGTRVESAGQTECIPSKFHGFQETCLEGTMGSVLVLFVDNCFLVLRGGRIQQNYTAYVLKGSWILMSFSLWFRSASKFSSVPVSF